MKKKTVKKLELAKETVRNLEDVVLGKAVGGYTDLSCAEASCFPYRCQNEPNISINGC